MYIHKNIKIYASDNVIIVINVNILNHKLQYISYEIHSTLLKYDGTFVNALQIKYITIRLTRTKYLQRDINNLYIFFF